MVLLGSRTWVGQGIVKEKKERRERSAIFEQVRPDTNEDEDAL